MSSPSRGSLILTASVSALASFTIFSWLIKFSLNANLSFISNFNINSKPILPQPSIYIAPTASSKHAASNFSSPQASTAILSEVSLASPLPTLKPSSQLTTSSQLDAWFAQYAGQFNVSQDQLRQIAACESGFNPSAQNGIYGGLYQFTVNAWVVTRTKMNADTNPDLRFNPEEAIKTAAYRIANNGTGAWPNCVK